jgi:hypothetical protein
MQSKSPEITLLSSKPQFIGYLCFTEPTKRRTRVFVPRRSRVQGLNFGLITPGHKDFLDFKLYREILRKPRFSCHNGALKVIEPDLLKTPWMTGHIIPLHACIGYIN